MNAFRGFCILDTDPDKGKGVGVALQGFVGGSQEVGGIVIGPRQGATTAMPVPLLDPGELQTATMLTCSQDWFSSPFQDPRSRPKG